MAGSGVVVGRWGGGGGSSGRVVGRYGGGGTGGGRCRRV